MRLAHAARVLGIFLMLFSFSLLPPLLVSRWYADGEAPHFLYSMFAIFGAGLLLWLPSSRRHIELRNRDGFLIVAFYWIGLGLLGALPFMFGPHLSYVDSVFEAVSGFTTTGATVIVGLDALPPSILYYRAQLQWLGGMGVIVLAVAILPMLGIGGMQLFRAETPGPMKDNKLTPRITHTARALWLIYFWLTVACAVALWLAGMTPFDAITHSFTALSTGGFSSHDDSVGYFKSPLIDYILISVSTSWRGMAAAWCSTGATPRYAVFSGSSASPVPSSRPCSTPKASIRRCPRHSAMPHSRWCR